MTNNAVKATLVAKKDGIYTVYVFKLEDNTYIMCTKLPNWDSPDIKINTGGFLTYEEAIAGDKYYVPSTDKFETYKYTNIYFKGFLEDIIKEKTEEIKMI